MWMMDHQMNIQLSQAFGQYFLRLPRKKSPTIVCGNALRLDWRKILLPELCSYVLGNPPLGGKQFAGAEHNADMGMISGKVKGGGVLDYAMGRYVRAGDDAQTTRMEVS